MEHKLKINDEVLVKGVVCETSPNHVSVRIQDRDRSSFLPMLPVEEVLPVSKGSYEDGQFNMWEKMKRMILPFELGGYATLEKEEIFGEDLTISDILSDYSLNEFISLTDIYENKRKLKIGEEIELTSGETYWIIDLDEVFFYGYYSGEDAANRISKLICQERKKTIFKKTGRTTDMIELIKGEKIK